MRIFAIILIITGILMFVFNGMEYQKESTVLNAGTFEIKKKHKEYIVWPSMGGGILLVSGIILLLRKRNEPAV